MWETDPAFDFQLVRRGITSEVLKRRQLCVTLKHLSFTGVRIITSDQNFRLKGGKSNGKSYMARLGEAGRYDIQAGPRFKPGAAHHLTNEIQINY